jgi:formate hydrogenlyase subunit 3/multisubunit Na+/H+ antiporter MnhD subunit
MTLVLFVLAALLLPLYPFSMGATALLQGGGTGGASVSALHAPAIKAALMLAAPVLGALLIMLGMSVSESRGHALLQIFAIWGGLTSMLYAFRMLSAKDAHIWLSHLYASALALIWVGAAHGVSPLLPALGLAASLLPLLFLLQTLTRQFGIARSGLYPGLGKRMPMFSLLFTAALLMAVAVPVSPGFFAVAELAFGGVSANELPTLIPISLSWLLWTWAGINLLTGIVFGRPREDLVYADIEHRRALAIGGAMLALAVLGILLMELVL